jgi:hypothetical protein
LQKEVKYSQIITGVRQGCVIFLLVIDWIMKRAADADTHGLEWVGEGWLTDLDFVDKIALLDRKWAGMVDLTTW